MITLGTGPVPTHPTPTHPTPRPKATQPDPADDGMLPPDGPKPKTRELVAA